MSVTSLDKFIKTLTPDRFENDLVAVSAPGEFVYEWVKDKFLDFMQDALCTSMGRRVRIQLTYKAQERAKPQASQADAVAASIGIPVPTVSKPYRQTVMEGPVFAPNKRQTFDNFVVGDSNRLAKAGSIAVADSPGGRYNPLFIHSYPGLGKTHLLHSIANVILDTRPSLGVVYMTAQMFTEDYVSAIQANKVEAFRRRIRSAGMWLLDDVQFIMGREKTQEEMHHMFNHLHDMGCPIVVCSDRHPRDLLGTHERLKSRFEMGLVVNIDMPDTETRAAIVLKKAEMEGFADVVSVPVAQAVAECVVGTVRVLEGAFNKVMAQWSLDRVPMTPEYARTICEKHYRNSGPPKPTFEQILDTVARVYRVDSAEILGTSRKANVAQARHVAVYITRELLGDSWKHIGAQFGDKDHTTMMHGYKKIRDMMDRDRDLSQDVKGLMRDLYPEA